MITAFLSAFVLYSIPIGFGIVLMGKKPLRDGIILLITSVFSSMLWRSNSPYPFPLNWDIWEHQTAVNAILSGTFTLLPSGLSDTFQFNGYTTLFHMWIAIPQYIFKPDVLGFWWFAETLHTFAASIAAYVLITSITKKKQAGIVAGILSAFFFESSLSYTSVFLMPQTVTAILWVFGFSYLLQKTSATARMLVMVPLSVILFSLHFIIGSVGIACYLFYLILEKTRILESTAVYVTALLALPIFVFGVLTGITTMFPVQSINFGEAGHFSNTVIRTWTDMCTWYGFLPVLLFPFGIIALEKMRLQNPGRICILLFFILTGLVFSPFPYVTKFIVLWRFLLIAFIGSGILFFLESTKNIIIKGVMLFFIIITCQTIFIANYTSWKQTITYLDIASQVSKDDRKTAEFLSTYRDKPVLLASDPATSYILEALSGVNSPGGAYMNTANRQYLASAFLSEDQSFCNDKLDLIRDGISPQEKISMVVISARTLEWLHTEETIRNSNAWNVWQPQGFSIRNTMEIQQISERCSLTPIFTTPSIVVFERIL